MSTDRNEWLTRETLGVLAFSLLVAYVVLGLIDLTLGTDVIQLLIVLFVLYLLYRLVVAVEEIARKL